MPDMVDDLLTSMIEDERARLAGPACEPGQHRVDHARGDWSRCDICCRTVRRPSAGAPWVAYCGSGCECRECQSRWSTPSTDVPRFRSADLAVDTHILMDADHLLGKNGMFGSGGHGRWRVTSFWREAQQGEWGSLRHEGKNLVQCGPDDALYVGLRCVCGALIRMDDLRAHATITW